MTGPAQPERDAGFAEVLDRLAREAGPGSDPHLHVATSFLPPRADPLGAWRAAAPTQFCSFWETRKETSAGIGTTVAGAPDARFGTHVPRWFGSIPFVTGWADEDWGPLVDGGFVMPRWTLHRAAPGESVKVSLAVRGPLRTEELEGLEDEFARLREAALDAGHNGGDAGERRGDAGTPAGGPASAGRAAPPDAWFARSIWDENVRGALAEIEAGRLEKVVLARRVAVPLPPGVSAVDILERLRAEGSGRFRFGLRNRGRAFVGASPECLFRKRGASVRIEAVAGTYDLDGEGADLVQAAEHLFASGKDLAEHAHVVRGVVEAIEPLSLSVVPEDGPEVREARGLAHLGTTVRANLRPEVSALDLVTALHPTPAVGGLPVEAAIRFIRRNEPAPRGLFAAPVGWIDAQGNACLAVAIRSALLLESHAWVYAGAGIVEGSDPAAEWDETSAKLRWFGELIEGERAERPERRERAEQETGGTGG